MGYGSKGKGKRKVTQKHKYRWGNNLKVSDRITDFKKPKTGVLTGRGTKQIGVYWHDGSSTRLKIDTDLEEQYLGESRYEITRRKIADKPIPKYCRFI